MLTRNPEGQEELITQLWQKAICKSFPFGLKNHISLVHEGKKPFKCSICNVRFAQNQGLKKHIAAVHEGKKPFKCSICDDSFTQIGSMNRHKKKCKATCKEKLV